MTGPLAAHIHVFHRDLNAFGVVLVSVALVATAVLLTLVASRLIRRRPEQPRIGDRGHPRID